MHVTLTATRPRSERTLGNRQYRCGMCGGVRTHRPTPTPPEYCKDCLPEAVALGWTEPPPPRKRRAKASTEKAPA